MSKKRVEAVAYLRTSSPTNVGPDKDSDKRQHDAIHAFAKRASFEIVGEFYDAGVKAADPIEGRPGFKALLDRIVSNGVDTVIVWMRSSSRTPVGSRDQRRSLGCWLRQ